MKDCLFCKIAHKEIPSEILYEDDKVVAFKDIEPQAPTHVLIIPKTHYDSILEVTDKDQEIVAHIHKVITQLAKDLKIAEKGFRIVNNCGEDGGQTVKHLHYHLLGGRNLQWPPG